MMRIQRWLETSPPKKFCSVGVASAILISMPHANAAEINMDNPDLKIRWDNTIKYSGAYRMKNADPALSGDINLGDGDTNFRKKGLISNRVDLLSELEIGYNNLGLRLSAATWHDTVYNKANQNNTAGAFGPSPSMPPSMVNSSEIASAQSFSPYTRATHGRDIEMLDAFASTKFNIGGHNATVRLGQHSVTWGESLFFGDNAIAGAMSPVDVAKALSVPNLRFQEILRPVPQVSGQIQVNSDVTAAAYYQFRWRENKSQGAGSYFSPMDFQPGGNLIFLPTGPSVRASTREGNNSGQGGVSLRIRGEQTDYGLYAVRFNSKSAATVINPVNGSFYDSYHSGITALGASANRSMGAFNFAVEGSVRNNQDLLSPNAYDLGAGAQYAVGKTLHINASLFGTNLGRTALWNDATLLGEVAFSRVMSITRNADTLSGCSPAMFPGSVCAPNGTRNAWRMQVLFEPIYYQVLPGVDLRVPMSLSYVPKGSRNMVGPAPLPENAGSVSLGVTASYLDAWRLSLNYTRYFGSPGVLFSQTSASTSAWNYRQYFRDRDHISVSLNRSF